MHRKIDIPNFVFLFFSGLTSVIIVVLGYFFITSYFSDHERQLGQLRERYMDSQKSIVRTEVRQVIDIINRNRRQEDERIRKLLKERVDTACDIVAYLYETNRDDYTDEEIKEIVKDVLRPIRFDNIGGYFIVFQAQDSLIINAGMPGLEGEGVSFSVPDSVTLAIEAGRARVAENGEGFYRYRWPMPDADSTFFVKDAYGRIFEPFDWLITTGIYRQEMEEQTKQDVLAHAEGIRFGSNGYIFILDHQGTLLEHPFWKEGIGTNVLGYTDSTGHYLFRDIINVSKLIAGGFTSYFWTYPTDEYEAQAPKITFAQSYDDWGWTIGAGVYTDEVEQIVALEENVARATMQRYISVIILLFLLILFASLGVSYLFARRMRREFKVFEEFFSRAATAHEPIDPGRLKFTEFVLLARNANIMLDQREHMMSALVDSERTLDSIIRTVPDLIYRLDAEGRVTFISESISRYGHDALDLLGMDSMDLIHPDDKAIAGRVLAERRAGARSGERVEVRLMLREKGSHASIRETDEEFTWFSVSAEGLYDKEMRYLGTQGIARDITAQRRTMIELLEYRNALEATTDNIAVINLDRRITGANQAYLTYFHLSRHETIGSRYDTFMKTYNPDVDSEIERCMAGETFEREARMEHPEYGLLYLTLAYFPIWSDVAGKVIGAVIIGRDITAKRIAEEQLAAEKERLTVTLRSIGDGVIATDLAGNVVLMNRVAEEMTGWHSAAARGRSVDEVLRLVDANTREPYEGLVDSILHSTMSIEMKEDTLLISRSGAERLIGDSGAPIRDRESRVIGAVIVFRDITDKKRMEREILKVEKLESIGMLAGGIAHDFNNLLTGIVGNISFARNTIEKDNEAHEALSVAEKEIMRARGLTHQLLTFSRGGAPVKKTMDIGALLRESVVFSLRGSDVVPEFKIEEPLPPVDVDGSQMAQVFNNLVINAKQAMNGGGRIRIVADSVPIREEDGYTVPPGRYVRIAITDEGEGIPANHISHIFDPFFTTKLQGSGLGLSTSYSIVSQHGGIIDVNSTLGTGTTFTIHLPVSKQAYPPEQAAPQRHLTGRGRLLVMDDEQTIREIVTKLLGRRGYTVETAADGDEAVAMYRAALNVGRPFDAVILDLTVPGGTGGRECIQELKTIDPNVCAIVSSGYSNDPVMANFEEYGFSGVAAKPYSMEELEEVLGQLLS